MGDEPQGEVAGGLRLSDSVENIAPALLSVQQEIEDPPRSGENPHFGSRYVMLEDLIHAVRPVLSSNGLTMMQAPGMEGGQVTVETVLLHKSGEWARNRASTPTDRADPQGIGSAITYLRRYSLAAMLGLAHEDDDDANRATDRQAGGRQASDDKPATDKQRGFIKGLLSERQVPDERREKIRTLLDDGMSAERASKCIDWLQEQPEAGDEPEHEEPPVHPHRIDVESWLQREYSDEWENQLRFALTRHPLIECGGDPEKVAPEQWGALKGQIEEHGIEAMVNEPREVIND